MSLDHPYVPRPDLYVRKRDGFTVSACDWPDGDVSWIIEPLPLVFLGGRIVGTCSAATFAKNHTKGEPLK